MKNPIILKDLLIGVNSVIGKVTIMVILFIVAGFTILSNVFGNDFSTSLPHYFSNDDFFMVVYFLGGLGLFGLGVIKGILSICLEKSQMTYELIKISKISASKYILGKFGAHLLYFGMLIVMLLPFVGMMGFLGALTFASIALLAVHLFIFGGLGIALGLMVGCIGRTIPLSFLIAVVGFICVFIGIDSFYLYHYFEEFSIQEYANWYYIVSFIVVIGAMALVYSIQYIKQDTFAEVDRYPLVLTVGIFVLGGLITYFSGNNGYLVFAIAALVDLVLFFIHIKELNTLETTRIKRHLVVLGILFLIAVIISEGIHFILLGYVLLMFILAFLLSINVILLYKKINFYLHKFIYLIMIAFVFFIVPSFVNNLKQIDVLKHIKIYIPSIENTFVDLIRSEQYFEKYAIYPAKKYNHYPQNTYNYIYVWIVFLFLLYCGLHYLNRKK